MSKRYVIEVWSDSRRGDEPLIAIGVQLRDGKVYVEHEAPKGHTTVLEPGDVNIISLVEA